MNRYDFVDAVDDDDEKMLKAEIASALQDVVDEEIYESTCPRRLEDHQ